MVQLRNEIGGLATTLAGRIVGESLEDDERARRTVDRFVADLEDSEVRAGGRVVSWADTRLEPLDGVMRGRAGWHRGGVWKHATAAASTARSGLTAWPATCSRWSTR